MIIDPAHAQAGGASRRCAGHENTDSLQAHVTPTSRAVADRKAGRDPHREAGQGMVPGRPVPSITGTP